jgi:hypothetical protein
MSQPPTPPSGNQPPYGSQPPYGGQPSYGAAYPYGSPPPRRQRPRKVWFVIGGVLVVLAPLIFVGSLFLVLRPLMDEDAVFAADGRPHQVDLPAGEERALFSESGQVDCTIVDGNDEQVGYRSPGGDFTYNEWTAFARFDTADGDLTFTCEGFDPDDRVRIAQLPDLGGFVGGILAGILLPILLGLTGLVMLVVTGVLYATGAPRQPRQSG